MEFEDLNALSELRFAMRVQILDELLRDTVVPVGYEAQVDDIKAMVANLKANAYGSIVEKYRMVSP